jgi:hypothetical protein
MEHAIEVFNVNGELIRRRPVSGAVTAWTTWCSASGFDFLMFAGEQGKVMFCEVFYLDMASVPACRVPSGVVALRYSRNEMGVVIACRNGDVVFCPFNHV